MGDSVLEEAMMASSLMDGAIIDDNYDAYADMSSFSANLCDVVQEDEMGSAVQEDGMRAAVQEDGIGPGEMYDGSEGDQEIYVNRSRRLVCKQCGKAFKNKILLKKHIAMHPKELLFECEQCNKKFSRKESLTRHQLVHSGMKFFECPECGRMFNQNGHLTTHMLVHTKEKNFECETCGMKFARKDNLKRHSFLHDKKKTFECHLCGKGFNQNGHLEAHMLVHTQERNFECQSCSMKFARRDTLKRHMLVHTKEKTHECDTCSAKFIQNSHLKAHMLVHTKERKFNCTDCDKKFARNGSLKRHRLVHTGERKFECPECGKTFIQKTHLNKHMITHSQPPDMKVEGENAGQIDSDSKVDVHIQHMNNTKPGDEKASPGKRPNGNVKASPKGLTVKYTNASVASVGNSKMNNNMNANKQTANTSSAMPKDGCKTGGPGLQDAIKIEDSGGKTQNSGPQVQQVAVSNGMQFKTVNQSGKPVTIEGQDPNNLLANSNSVMALALLDHFLTGNESQENVGAQQAAAPSATAKSKNGNNQWGQKTHQELLAAQTLSAIGQRGSTPNEAHQMYGQVPFVTQQVSACNTQPVVSQGVLTSSHSAMKIRPPANVQWMPQDKTIMHQQNVVYNVPPPPAHEIFRYYAPSSMPLHYATDRLPDGSCIPADMRASPRKPKYPQKVVLPGGGEWQTSLPMHPANMNPNIHVPVYAHSNSKHPSELPRMLDKP